MAAPCETVFLTGGTGVLGRRIATMLARRGHVVQMLVRRNSRRLARQWLSELRREEGEAAGRILLMSGDLTDEGILDQSARSRVLDDSSSIIHCAAAQLPTVDHQLAWQTNVEGTRRLLELALAHPRLRTFVHVSDLAIAGDHRGVFGEDDLLLNQRFSGAYGQSKLLAERRVRASASRLPVRIVRPASLVGEQADGRVERAQPLHSVVASLVRFSRLAGPLRSLPIAPLGSCARVSVLPVDWVAETTLRLWEAPDLDGRTFQLCDPDAPTVRDFLGMACERLGIGAPVLDVPRRPWLGLWRSPLGRLLPGLVPGGTALTEASLSRVIRCSVPDSSQTEQVLRRAGVSVPHLPDYLDGIMEYTRGHFV